MGGVRLIGNSKLAVSVNVSIKGCLPLCVSPGTAWRPVQVTLSWVSRRKWMDGYEITY